jgi:uncharacterized OB-fold protein
MNDRVAPGPVLPIPDEITGPWWDATRESRLLLQRCTGCSHVQHYPRAICTACASTNLEWIESRGRGTVDSFTIVQRAPGPAFEAPYVIARVTLVEGPTLLTKIIGASPEELICDAPVSLDWEILSDGHQLPVFRITNP